jgi:hypothetical protein
MEASPISIRANDQFAIGLLEKNIGTQCSSNKRTGELIRRINVKQLKF